MKAGHDYLARMAPMTAEDLERLYIPGKKVELVRGVPIVQELPSTLHSLVSGEFFHRLRAFVDERELGFVFPQDAGFKIASNPDTVRGADIAFVSRERMPEVPRRGNVPLAPDLVIRDGRIGWRPVDAGPYPCSPWNRGVATFREADHPCPSPKRILR